MYRLFALILSCLALSPALAQEAESKVVRVESVVLSDLPQKKPVEIPVQIKGAQFHLTLDSHLYYLSKSIKLEKEFADRQTMVTELRKMYCADAPAKHTWTYKMNTPNPQEKEPEDSGFLGGQSLPMLVGLLNPHDPNQKLQPASINRLIITYKNSQFERVSKDDKIDWDFVRSFTDEVKCKED